MVLHQAQVTATALRFGYLICGDAWQLGYNEFESVMKLQIKLFVQRQLSNALTAGSNNHSEVGLLSVSSAFPCPGMVKHRLSAVLLDVLF